MPSSIVYTLGVAATLYLVAMVIVEQVRRHRENQPADEKEKPLTECPDHGPLSDDGRCYECEHNDLLIDTMLEDRAWPRELTGRDG